MTTSVFAGPSRHVVSDRVIHVALAAIAYLPLLRTRPDEVGADTKHYLYLDPGQLMERAASVWDPSIGLGTVSHQNVGYLWPMGPWYWFWDQIGVADWVAQRLWLATLMFAAGAGVMFLLRQLGMRGLGAGVAAFSYMLSPYILAYAARISAILLPWAGLPWLLAITVLALRRGGWRWPAVFALVVTTVGSINASSLVYAAVAVLLWFPFAVAYQREVSRGAALRVAGRMVGLTVLTQVWWLVALALSGAYGPPVLETTETFEAVSTSSLSTEVLRSLGNWFFYGRDAIGPWVQASVPYTQEAWLIAISFALPVVAFASAAVVRWQHRTYFTLLIVAGAAIAIAAFPFDDPSPFGALSKELADSSTLALALRNAQRAGPLVALGVAVLLGSLVHAIGDRMPWGRALAAAPLALLVLANVPALWSGELVDENLRRPEQLPEALIAAAEHLDAVDDGTRVFEVPGTDFAAYRWGNTVDPVLPGLLDRPWVGRESAPQGTAGSINLINAIDRRLQEGTIDVDAIGPVARLVNAGDLVLRGDLQTERYRTPRPRVLTDLFDPVPAGLTEPVTFGPPVPNRPPADLPLIDAIELGTDPTTPWPAPLTTYRVVGARPIVHAAHPASSVILSGDGDGIVDGAPAGLLSGEELIFYSGDLGPETGPDRPLFDRLLDERPLVVVTDTNRRRAERFTTLRENTGYTEAAGEEPLVEDAADARIPVFGATGAGLDDPRQTVTVLDGIDQIRASAYGNPVTYIPEERPALAVDDDLRSAWKVAAFSRPVGERISIDLEEPTELDRIRLVQPVTGDRNRHITAVTITFDDGSMVRTELVDASRTADGQLVEFSPRTTRTIDIRIDADSVGERSSYEGLSAVGFAEIDIPGIDVTEMVRLPTDATDELNEIGYDGPLAFVFTRLRADPAEPVRRDPEPTLRRRFEIPAGMAGQDDYVLVGSARLAAGAPDALLDELVGLRSAERSGVTATSSARLPGSVASRASAALDGDRGTAWTPPLGPQPGHWVRFEFGRLVRTESLALTVSSDSRHSRPTRLRLETDTGQRVEVDVPAIASIAAPGSTATVDIPLPEVLRYRALRITILATTADTTIDYFSRSDVELPVSIHEVGLSGGETHRPIPEELAGDCRDDLVTLDGEAVGIRVIGPTAAAVAGSELVVETCDPTVELTPGPHTLTTVAGADSGLDLDRVVLSRAGDAPASDDVNRATVTAQRNGRSGFDVRVRNADAPFWLVLGESWSDAWEATVDGPTGLGEPVRVNGFANAWFVDPALVDDGDGTFDVALAWTPQRWAGRAQQLSLAAVILCVFFVLTGRRTRSEATAEPPRALAPVPTFAPAWDQPGRVIELVPTVAVALLVGGITSFFFTPAAGPLFAGLAIVMAVRARARALLPVAAAGALAVAGMATLAVQMWKEYPPGFGWAGRFEALHPLGWVAICLLLLDAVLEITATRSAPPSEPRPAPETGR